MAAPRISPFCPIDVMMLQYRAPGILVQVFEKGNFAGLEEMKHNPRLFDRVAPMGVNDIIMAVSYQHRLRPPLQVQTTAFDGLLDHTIERGNMEQWGQYTTATFRKVLIEGDHYIVSSQHRQVSERLWGYWSLHRLNSRNIMPCGPGLQISDVVQYMQ